jgi:hypothetical protein
MRCARRVAWCAGLRGLGLKGKGVLRDVCSCTSSTWRAIPYCNKAYACLLSDTFSSYEIQLLTHG